jgi:pimeloyl-ACP methyl ester carboxylesterase
MRSIEFTSGGRTLVADVQGKGPALLFMHGQFGISEIVRSLVAPLATEWTVITPDIRGRGRSVCPAAEEHTWDQYSDDCLAVLNSLGSHQAVLGGVSLGAGLALAVALRHPERVSALVLHSNVYAGEAIGWRDDQRRLQAGVLEAARAVREGSAAASEVFSPKKWQRHDLQSIAAAIVGLGFAQPFGAIEELQALKVPCMIVPGADPMHPREVSELYAERIERAVWSETSYGEFPEALQKFLGKAVHGNV